ncbi:MAG: right-handed parallel beta-helix repeat-containing protein, partial [Treponema sp.]|nr:right-handed parallel beta-helix repeat-containing protein [Treponema sp.]
IYNRNSSPVLINATITKNSATNGGGFNDGSSSSPVLINVTIAGNHATSAGGGFYTNSFPAVSVLTNVVITGNTAGTLGGGIYLHSSPALTNVVITGNTTTTSRGGGIYISTNSSPVLTNVTIAGNYANSDGGGIANMSATTSTPEIRNSIIWGNIPDAIYSGAPVITDSIVEGIDSDPQFADLQQATSSAATTGGNFRLTATSPARDTGNNNLYPDEWSGTDGWSTLVGTSVGKITGEPEYNTYVKPYLATDITGVTARIKNGTIDIGAYEF